MPEVGIFADIAAEFDARVRKIAWCSVATTDRAGRLRSRILHPIWEDAVGWIATGRQTLKTKHLAASPWVTLTYWDPDHEQIYADCKAEWADDQSDKDRIWNLYKTTEPPLGYDPAMIWPGGPGDPSFGLLKLTPWRIEISGIHEMSAGQPPRVWHQDID